jgi:hypothetical protein
LQELVANVGDCEQVLFNLSKEHFYIEDAMCGVGGRMRGAVHSSLIFSLFFSFASKAKERKRLRTERGAL